jgi:hypothetical protein
MEQSSTSFDLLRTKRNFDRPLVDNTRLLGTGFTRPKLRFIMMMTAALQVRFSLAAPHDTRRPEYF